jgi:hypothetical protein
MVKDQGYYFINKKEDDLKKYLVSGKFVIPERTLRNRKIEEKRETKYDSLLSALFKLCGNSIGRDYLKTELKESDNDFDLFCLVKKDENKIVSFILLKKFSDKSNYLSLVCGKMSSFLIVKAILESKKNNIEFMFLNAVGGKLGGSGKVKSRLPQYYSGYGFEFLYTEKMICTDAGKYSASFTDTILVDGKFESHVPFISEKCDEKNKKDDNIDITDYIHKDYAEKILNEWNKGIVPMVLDLEKVDDSCLLKLIENAKNMRNVDCRDGKTTINENRNPKIDVFYEDELIQNDVKYIPKYGKKND